MTNPETEPLDRSQSPRPEWSIALAMAVAAASAVPFLPALGNGFVVFFDDDVNFLNNAAFRGLAWPQIRWAWSTFLLGVYQPLAWILAEAEYTAFGLDPRGYHLTSVVLHSCCAAVLYALIFALASRSADGPGGLARHAGAAIAAVLFAVHPLRAEVVAWASCQPYLPAVLFAMLAVLAYLRACDGRRAWLAVAWGLSAAALLSKAVAVSLPFVLMIVDAYPLGRVGRARGVWVEKVPFLALSVPFMLVAMIARGSNRSRGAPEWYGPLPRLAQACYGIWFYPIKTLCPVHLTAFYPLPHGREDFFAWPFVLAAMATVAATLAVFAVRRRWPGIAAAWGAYLVILAPNLGLASVGNYIAADRYSYAATIPWAVLIGCGLERLFQRPKLAAWVGIVGVAMAIGLSMLTWRQVQTWRNAETLWAQVLRAGDDRARAPAHVSLGTELARQGRLVDAMAEQTEALRLDPHSAEAHNGIGELLARQGRLDEAYSHFAESVRRQPDDPTARNNLGVALGRRGDFTAAIPHLAAAVRLDPDSATSRRNLGLALARQGALRRAIGELSVAARLEPSHAETHRQLADLFIRAGRPAEAIAQLTEALRLDPNDAQAERALSRLRPAGSP